MGFTCAFRVYFPLFSQMYNESSVELGFNLALEVNNNSSCLHFQLFSRLPLGTLSRGKEVMKFLVQVDSFCYVFNILGFIYST